MPCSNVLELIGVCTLEEPWMIVLEFVPHGDLKQVCDAILMGHIQLMCACSFSSRPETKLCILSLWSSMRL